ncbi:hypothetical protein BJV82DRAFT_512614 [Fennellomyces sp. T-0311]|nr:hypothetical protein BJV82DRAFT_512614 [Fennellomyces sp. T-0311]
MTLSERVYVIGGTGNAGTAAVKELLKNGISVTAYVRSPAKAQRLFPNEPNLTIVEGDVNDLKPLEESIAGHTRLFLLVNDLVNLAKIKTEIAQKAYARGVKQVVDISSLAAAYPWRSSPSGIVHQEAEQSILDIPNRGTFVTLRPGLFMSNHFWLDLHSIQAANTIVDIQEPEAVQHWISPNDIGLTAANILQEPIKKHGDAVYDLIGDAVSLKDRAEILSKVLDRPIAYTKVTAEEQYKNYTQAAGLPHTVAFSFLKSTTSTSILAITPGFSILLGRAPETLAQYLETNKAAFL